MSISTEIPEMYEKIDERVTPGATVQILQYKNLKGSSDVRSAEQLFFATQAGMRLKMVRIVLNKSHARIEPGALYYMNGSLEIKASTGGGILKGIGRKMLTGETFFVNEIHGSGEIYLEPTYGHFFLHEISGDEQAVIVDRGLFYGGTSGLDVSASVQKNISSAAFGGEGLFQTKIAGNGISILYSPVPVEEIQKFEIKDSKVSVDGNFTLMRSAGITFRAEKSSKSWVATSVSGEGLLQTFSGSGNVWVAPTQGVYEKLATPEGLEILSKPPGSSHTQTESSKR